MQVWTTTCHDCEGSCICTTKVCTPRVDGAKDIVVNPECTVTGHADTVYSVTFSPDGKRIVSLSSDMWDAKGVKMWDAKTGAEVISFVGGRSVYRGTSLIRNNADLGPYSRAMPRALWWS